MLREHKLGCQWYMLHKSRALNWVVLNALKVSFPRNNAENKKSKKKKAEFPGNS